MRIEPFKLEKWLLNTAEIDLGGGVVSQFKLKDVTRKFKYDELLSYGDRRGSETLRREVAEWYRGVEPENILITSGTSEANLLVNLALLESGDDYVAEYPLYDQPPGFARSLGCQVKRFYLDEIRGWRPDLEQIKEAVTKKTKVIFFDNPNNPTGALLTEQEMKAIVEIAEDVGAYVVCDNALRGSEIDGRPGITPFEYYEKAIVTGSMSKLGMIGPRIGWVIASRQLLGECWKFKDYTTLCHAGLSDYLATIALKTENRTKYMKRNLRLSEAVLPLLTRWINENSSLVSWVPPKAGFTAFPKYSLSVKSEELCKKALKEENLLLSPGEHFGIENHFRINFGCETATMTEALKRLTRLLNRLK